MKIYTIVTILLCSVVFLSCSKKKAIYISGSTTVLPIISKAAEAYQKTHPDVSIIVNAGGSGVGINQLGEGKVDIGMISRDLTEDEISKYPTIIFNPIAIGKDAVVAVVSSEIYDAGIRALSLSQMAQIYTGKIENWKELEGPDQPILCVDKEKSRGTRHIFMDIVLGDKEAEAPGADLVLGSNNEEQTAIVQSDAAIGMLSNAWLNKDVKGLSIIKNDSVHIAPNFENIVDGTYPIIRDLEIVVNGEPQGDVKSFINFILSSEGQEFVAQSGYVRLAK